MRPQPAPAVAELQSGAKTAAHDPALGPSTSLTWGSGTMNFLWVAGSDNCVWDGASCTILGSGATIGPASSFGAGNPALYLVGNTTGYLGFEFDNGGTTNYGYALFTTTAGTGYPATLVEYWYDNTGAAISIP